MAGFAENGGMFDYGVDLLRKTVSSVVAEEEGLADLPIVTGMEFGRTDPMFVLPYGVLAQLDCGKQEFSILESAVVD
jgi:muramoyltetrapeptide carboxypeptidase LdcA involved in peptidoglycan recycling